MAGQFTASYEPDLSGRVQRTIEGARATAEQTAADFENTRLLLTADLATAYFNLRALDIELDVLDRSIELQRRALGLATERHDLGATSGLDVAQQQALLDSTLTQVDVLKKQRSQFEHAIATLAGTAAPLFALAPDVKLLTPPAVPVGVPSDVLQRRPDVASAERAMAAANAQIGVANAAFYPSIVLGGGVGHEGRTLPLLFDAPSLIWSLGVSLTAPSSTAAGSAPTWKTRARAMKPRWPTTGASCSPRCRKSRTASPASPRWSARMRRPRWPRSREQRCSNWQPAATRAASRPIST